MKPKIPGLAVVVLLVVVAAAAASIHKELLNVPRIRVGPLRTDVPAHPRMRFFALGEAGSGDDAQQRVAAAMESRCRQGGGVDGILLLGDNAYPGGFSSVDDPQWQSKITVPYGSDCLGAVPIYPVLGEHDYKGNPASEVEFSLVNKRWRMPNRFYSVVFGHLLKLVAIDSNVFEVCLKPGFCGVDFLIGSLGQRDTAWTFVMANHPLESSSAQGFAYRGGLLGRLLEPYLCNRADLYLSGHAHHLEHLKPADCRLDLFVAGGGGAELYEVRDPRPASRFAQSRNGFLELDVDEQVLTARFIDASGQVLEETTKTPAP